MVYLMSELAAAFTRPHPMLYSFVPLTYQLSITNYPS